MFWVKFAAKAINFQKIIPINMLWCIFWWSPHVNDNLCSEHGNRLLKTRARTQATYCVLTIICFSWTFLPTMKTFSEMITPIRNFKQEHDRTIFFMSSLTLLLFQVKVKVKVKVKTLILRLCCSLKLVLTHTSLRQPAQHRDHHHQLQWMPHNDNDNAFNNFKITVEKKGLKKEITQEEER